MKKIKYIITFSMILILFSFDFCFPQAVLLLSGALSVNGGGDVDFLKVSCEKKFPDKILFPGVISVTRGQTSLIRNG